MGAEAIAAVAVYAAPEFDPDELHAFIEGARDVCELTDSRYVGGDPDQHEEFTVASSAIGPTDAPTLRSTAPPGECVRSGGPKQYPLGLRRRRSSRSANVKSYLPS
jgi:thiamine-monophosphate kinase